MRVYEINEYDDGVYAFGERAERCMEPVLPKEATTASESGDRLLVVQSRRSSLTQRQQEQSSRLVYPVVGY